MLMNNPSHKHTDFKIMATKPSPREHWQRNDWHQLPIVSVNWYDTQRFIKTLTQKDIQYHYRLPTAHN